MNKIGKSFGAWDINSLGEGGFGEVYHCVNRYTGQEVATKRLKNSQHLKPDEIHVLKKRWLQEHQWIHSIEKSNYIVDAVQIDDSDFLNYLKKQNDFADLPVIIMEYCNGGDLRDYLNKVENSNGCPEKVVRDILLAIRQAVEYLHEKCKIEHRDIKPENIVIKNTGNNQKLYKLTDFGYAKDIPESTIAQSVVGTRHYVAPEVVDPGHYTQTVDYWAVGVMAFEIMCGLRPFIPHQNIRNIMHQIILKPKNCIAIQQLIEEPITDRFLFIEHVFPENFHSQQFIDKMEKWLCMALDKNYKTRGYRNNELKFYSELDSILKTKILTIFSLKSYKVYNYEIDNFHNMPEFFNKLAQDTGILRDKIFLCLPTGHPKGSLRNIRQPMDFFVPEWCDTSNKENPPVMLYLIDASQCDCNASHDSIKINATLKAMMQKDPETFMKNENAVPSWLLEQFEKQVHYVLSKQHYLLECYLQTLYEYALNLEHEAFQQEQSIKQLCEATLLLNGRVKQFEVFVKEYLKTHETEVSWLKKSEAFSKDAKLLKEKASQKVLVRYESVLKHCRELASYDIYKKLPEQDIFKLCEFRQFLTLKKTPVERLKKCQEIFENLYQSEFEKFIGNATLKYIREALHKQLILYLNIRDLAGKIQKQIFDMEKTIDEETSILMHNAATSIVVNNDPSLALKMNSLCIDGSGASCSQSISNIVMNGHCSLMESGAFDPKTAEVIEESNKLLSLMTASMEIDEDFSMDIPTTITNI